MTMKSSLKLLLIGSALQQAFLVVKNQLMWKQLKTKK